MRVCVIFCSTIPALKFTFFKEELFGLCPENSGTPRQLRFSYSTENSEKPKKRAGSDKNPANRSVTKAQRWCQGHDLPPKPTPHTKRLFSGFPGLSMTHSFKFPCSAVCQK
jgi:hypothetical protein